MAGRSVGARSAGDRRCAAMAGRSVGVSRVSARYGPVRWLRKEQSEIEREREREKERGREGEREREREGEREIER